MDAITDEFIQMMLAKARNYSVVLLKDGPNRNISGVEKIVWEHVRRNFQLRADGLLSIVGPVSGDTGVAGFGVFNLPVEETKKIMDEDPAVRAGIFVFEIYSCRSFPGDSLP